MIANLINKTPNKIEAISIDVTIREQMDILNEATEYPIENGSSFTDHFFQKPIKLVLECINSDTPLGYFNISGLNSLGLNSYSKNIFEKLLEYAGYKFDRNNKDSVIKTGNPVLLFVQLGYTQLSNMVITKLSFPRDITTGHSLKYTVELQKIQIVKSKISVIDNTNNKNGKYPEISSQNQNTINVSKQEPNNESVLYKLVSKFMQGK